MIWPSRLIASVGTVAIFWPVLAVEVAGFAAIALVLLLNFVRSRRERAVVAAA
jgi:hypothetical protein